MKSENKVSVKILRKIGFISLIIIIALTIGVLATKKEVNYVTISFPEGYETTVVTSEVKVSKILAENHIIVLQDEDVSPSKDSNIDISKKISINKKTDEKKVISEEDVSVSTEQILGEYVTITEKIIIEQVPIPFETITKDVSKENTETKDTVLQEGIDGLKEIKYKVKYKNDIEIERNIISETIIKEPVDKIIQISTKITTRANMPRNSGSSLENAIEGKSVTVVNVNASAYCSCSACCGKSNGITSSGRPATEWHTVAAGSGYPIGTVIYIPALADKPNGGWFVVEDRGGAISNNRIDVYMGSHSQALTFGRRNLECYIYK